MTLTLELSEDLALRIRTRADAHGLPVNAYATQALADAVADADEPAGRQTDDSYALAVKRFRQLASDLEAGLPQDRVPLSDLAISRASIYEDENPRL